jgi:hypothetical protein
MVNMSLKLPSWIRTDCCGLRRRKYQTKRVGFRVLCNLEFVKCETVLLKKWAKGGRPVKSEVEEEFSD